MAFDEELAPDWFYELPFYLTTLVLYGVLFTLNPTLRWGARERAADRLVPIEFVAALPAAPSPNLAPAPAGNGRSEAPPRKGPGKYEPEKIKAGAPHAPPKLIPNPKPAAKAPARPAVDVKAVLAASIARRRKTDATKAAKAAAAAESARRAAEAAAESARRAEAARVERERRAAAERARQNELAAARAAKAARKAELSQELATMNEPDTALDGGAPPPASASKGGRARASGAELAGARRAVAAESADPGDAAGSGGADLLDAQAKGGGTGPDGSGVSYSLDGPVGSRRVLKRPVPTSPDWVGTRGLDLTVTVRFQVLPDGTVKPGAVILKTSGFPEIDRRALDALRGWLFEAVPSGGAAEVWGRVKFRFTS